MKREAKEDAQVSFGRLSPLSAVANDVDLGKDLNVLPSQCLKKRLERDHRSTMLFVGCRIAHGIASHDDTEQRRSNYRLFVLLPRRPRNSTRTSQTTVKTAGRPCGRLTNIGQRGLAT